MKPDEISLATEDKELYKELCSLELNGVKVHPEVKKSSDLKTVRNVIIAVSNNAAIIALAGWLVENFRQRKTKKGTINGHRIPEEKGEVIILIKNQLKANTPAPKEKKKNP